VFTDKLVAKIPSTASGVVREIHFANDTICAVGHTVMTIETDDGVETPVI
jgi:pyruvate/2-oxoglutarate dehydrogenase complex dihydrolipoamide acyltransferase (E2) component